MRVFRDHDLETLKAYFDRNGCPTAWVVVPHQGKTLHASDTGGVPVEFCATMDVVPRMITQFHRHKGGAAHRIDHYQIMLPDVAAATAFYTAAGFRLSEYISPDSGELVGVFLQRKGNPHDIVFFKGTGPRLHHIAFTSPESLTILRACDVAGTLGFGAKIERGPGRHGPGHAFFVYFRDPDGHRIELFSSDYFTGDPDLEPLRWSAADPTARTFWGARAPDCWYDEASPFRAHGGGLVPVHDTSVDERSELMA
jgi:catechol 2,3-dioxygenase